MRGTTDYPMRPAALVDWDAVSKRYADLVYSVAIKFRLSEHDAAEVFQNTWIVALGKANAPEDSGMAPWLASIACWQARHLLRKRRSSRIEDDAYADVADPDEPQPHEVIAAGEAEQGVRDALAELPPRDRALIQALYLSDTPVPYADIAARLGLAIGSIGMLRQRALDRLHDAMTRRAAV